MDKYDALASVCVTVCIIVATVCIQQCAAGDSRRTMYLKCIETHAPTDCKEIIR